jgi:cell division protein FtsL
MTPPAATAAGRTLTRPVAPRAPRRVSGPAARPRRGADAPRTKRTAAPDPFILRALHRTRALADSRFLDRLIRGRLWIPIVAAGLMGIVFMQVSMLKLNAGIGRAVQSAATLERQNANLRAAVSGMESGTRIDAAARKLGMVVPADGSTHYVTAATHGLAAAAASRMTAANTEAIARSKAVTALAAGQTTGAALTTAATGAVATQTAAATPATTATAPPTGTVAAAPTAAETTAPAAATATPPPATQQPTGATAAPATQTQTQTQTQQPVGTSAAASTSGGAVAPPQG